MSQDEKNLSQKSGGGGNTISPPPSKKPRKNTKSKKVTEVTDSDGTEEKGENLDKAKRARKWCFTLNNYSDEEYKDILSWCKSNRILKYIVGKEVGGASGLPHLQGYIVSKEPIRFNTLKNKNKRVHWEVARGSDESNRAYCSKEGSFESNIKPGLDEFQQNLKIMCLKPYENVIWKVWQKNVITIVGEEPDPRRVYWFWDKEGNIGKSFLTKYICLMFPTILADGKRNDVFNCVLTSLNNQIIPKVIILDIPRSSLEFVNYGMIEQVKNGCFYSGKYEGGMCLFPNPHVIIFSNAPPDESKLSTDRWAIKDLGYIQPSDSIDDMYNVAVPLNI